MKELMERKKAAEAETKVGPIQSTSNACFSLRARAGSYLDGFITMQLLSAYACLDVVPDLPLSPLSRQSATSKATAQRQKTDAVRQKFLNTDRGVDLLFIVDVTGSMAAWIAAVRAKIDLIIKEQVRTHIQHVHLIRPAQLLLISSSPRGVRRFFDASMPRSDTIMYV